jgi:diguanylate cyclase (GGDEF)-like protein/PAS domain S-box-containing protein
MQPVNSTEIAFDLLLESMPVAIYMKDSEGKVIYKNRLGRTLVREHALRDHFIDIETGERRRCRAISERMTCHDDLCVEMFVLIDDSERNNAEDEAKINHEKLRSLFDLAPLGIAMNFMDGRFVEFNEAFKNICGYTRKELSAIDYWTLTPNEYESLEQEQLDLISRTGRYGPYEKEYVRKDGTRVPVRLNGVRVTSNDGSSYIWSIVEDITEQRRSEESARLARLIYETSSDAVIVADGAKAIIDVNHAFTRITGYTVTQAIGQQLSFMQLRADDGALVDFETIIDDSETYSGQLTITQPGGVQITLWSSIRKVYAEQGSPKLIVKLVDITRWKKQEELIWREANFDALTELPNRRLFRERLEIELVEARGVDAKLALLFIDLDHFKEANDTLGHCTGDAILVEAGRRIQRCVRSCDCVARLGGDEFTVIIIDARSTELVEVLATKIIEVLSDPFMIGKETLYLSASIGITLFPDHAQDSESLLRHADRAMYQAKQLGRNRCVFFTDELQRKASEKLSLASDLRRALSRQELEIYYQPIVDLHNGLVTKAEALLRWRHPTRGAISPALFIPIAEEFGIISALTEFVVKTALSDAARWKKSLWRPFQISVNVSAIQFSEESKGRSWLRQVFTSEATRGLIILEITESVLLHERADVKELLSLIRQNDLEIAIDDFGTGYSSLAYLQKFKIDFLKIDRSFIQSLEDNATNMALTEAIIIVAQKLGVKSVAEGVETKAQRDFLLQAGCDFVQGYYYAKPMPRQVFERCILRAIMNGG